MSPIDNAIVVAYLLGMAGLGLYLQRRRSTEIDGYFLGERRLPWWLLGISGMSSNLDCTGTMIIVALVFSLGMSGFFVEIRGGVVLVLAFLMAFMGKWYRRAHVMTLAEWMHFRFGRGRDGDVARLMSAVAQLALHAALVTYFCTGTGKFITQFVRVPAFLGVAPEFWAAATLVLLAMVYTVACGLRGVVYADCIRSVVTFAAIVAACWLSMSRYALPERFTLSAPVVASQLEAWQAEHPGVDVSQPGALGASRAYRVATLPGERPGEARQFLVYESDRDSWTSVVPPRAFDFPPVTDYASFNLILLAIAFYVLRTGLEGYAGVQGYMAQRYFAAASDRECGLLSLLWTALLAFRWPFVAAVAVMGVRVVSGLPGGAADPERVLPLVVQQLFPVGLRGLLVAGLMAAAMSTFDATVNSGASYWARDVYGAFLRPGATPRQLVVQARLGSVGIVVVGAALSLLVRNINDIWGFFTMGISAGLFVPLLLRWFWWRLNGWGFAAGTLAGIAAAVACRLFLPAGTAEYRVFLLVSLASLVTLVVATLLTRPPDTAVLDEFYRRTRPFGFWGPVRAQLAPATVAAIAAENRRDVAASAFAAGWQLSLFLGLMTVVLKRWDHLAWLSAVFATCSVALYFLWWRHLDARVDVAPAAAAASEAA